MCRWGGREAAGCLWCRGWCGHPPGAIPDAAGREGAGLGSGDRPVPRVKGCLGPQARVERMEQFQKEKEELERGCRECRRKVAECQRRLKELEAAEGEGSKAELERLQAEAQQLRKEERSWEQKLEEMRKKEKSMPWNVDTLSKDGFSKVRGRGRAGCTGWRAGRWGARIVQVEGGMDRRAPGGEGRAWGWADGAPHRYPPLICPKALARGHTCHTHAPAASMLMAPSPPPPWMGWALRPRPGRPSWRRRAASPQPTPPLAPSQSMVNTKPEQAEEESEEVREQKHKTFVEKYEKQIKHFGELGAGWRGPPGGGCGRQGLAPPPPPPASWALQRLTDGVS